MLLAALALCVIAPVRLPQPFVVPTIALAATLCLFSSLRGNSYSGRLATPLVWIGERSYSIYLCHLPLIHVVREVTHRTIGPDAVFPLAILPYAGFAVLLALAAELSYRLIEVPLRRRGHATGNPEFAGTQPA
jgi:peptidoglycan/LPS O-acetylase OafA/YrhL